MEKINLLVCENYYPEFKSACEKGGFDDVTVVPFPSTCVNKSKKKKAVRLFAENGSGPGVVLCSKNCDSCALIPPESTLEVHTANYCFSHLTSEPFINYVLAKGGYIIGSGWLQNWQQRIADAGFDQETAKCFYHECCRELLFFDAGVDQNSENDMTELAHFLDLPFVMIPVELDSMKIMINSALAEHRLHKKNVDSRQAISEIQTQCAEYAAIFDLMSRISTISKKRDAIEKVKEIFVVIFGAQQFKYWNSEYETESFPEDIKALLLNAEQEYLLSKEDNRFCIKIKWHEKIFGAIDVSGFLFPEYIEKYLNFALEIATICGLVFSNNEQYEKILKSEQDMRYTSTHDALTDLYNRAYINEILDNQTLEIPFTVFMFDIDRLKFVNDQYGHAEGDNLIRSVALILEKCIRETDVLARIGGDEFVAILQGINADDAEIFKIRIEEEIKIHNRGKQNDHLKISFSIGYARGDKREDTIETVMKSADEQMYKDKENKRALLN